MELNIRPPKTSSSWYIPIQEIEKKIWGIKYDRGGGAPCVPGPVDLQSVPLLEVRRKPPPPGVRKLAIDALLPRVQRKGPEMEAPECAEGAHAEWKAGRADQVAGLRRHRKELS